MVSYKELTEVIYNNTYEHGRINVLDIQEVNARQYEVTLQHNDNKPETFYVNMYEKTICTINVNTRERGPIYDLKLAAENNS